MELPAAVLWYQAQQVLLPWEEMGAEGVEAAKINSLPAERTELRVRVVLELEEQMEQVAQPTLLRVVRD
jgi:hypothetical protein